jgi:hypothetical protein
MKPIYEHWGTPEGREGIQRTLVEEDPDDALFAAVGIREVDERGNVRTLTVEELNARGVRRSVAAKNITTGEMKPSRSGPFFIVKGS